MFSKAQLHIGVYGGIGGILPNLMDLANQLIDQDLGKWFGQTTNVFLALLGPSIAYIIYFCVGGFIAMALEETRPVKAIVLGISAPALIASWLSGDTPRVEAGLLHELLGSRSAYAQDNETDNGGQLEVVILGVDELEDKLTELKLKFKSIGPEGATHQEGELAGNEEHTLMIPEGGVVVFYGDAVNAETLAVTTTGKTYAVSIRRNYWNDFFRALGVRSKQPYDITVKLNSEETGA